MSLITRTYTFTDGTTAYGSQVDSEFSNIVNTLNNLDAGTSTWDIISVKNALSVPLIVDNSTGSTDIVDFKANGATKVSVNSTGALVTTAGITMGSQKITGLANGTASGDAAAFGQIKVLQTVTSTTNTATSTSSATFQAATGQSVTITPTSSSNRILVIAYTQITTGGDSDQTLITLKRGTTELSGQSQGFGRLISTGAAGQIIWPVTMVYVDSPATTSATTYQVFFAGDGTHSTATGSSTYISTITAMEIV